MNLKRRIVNFYYRFTNACKIWYWAFKNPGVIHPNNLGMVSGLYDMILKTANEHRHMMTHIAYIHPTEGEQEIVSIWAGSGLGASPTKRISELLKENAELKRELTSTVE